MSQESASTRPLPCAAATVFFFVFVAAVGVVPQSAAADAADPAGSGRAFDLALQAVLEGATPLDVLHLFVECFDGPEFSSVEVFGRGVGIWDDRRQFSLDHGAVLSLVQAMDEADLADLAETYGGDIGHEMPRRPDSSGNAVELICRLEVEIGSVEKRVVQLAKGERSEEFLALATKLLGICREAARDGIEPENLAQGLREVAAGHLIPEALGLTVHRKPAASVGDETSEEEGFLLRLRGRTAASRSYGPESGYGAEHRFELPAEEFRQLADDLEKLAGPGFPQNLWAAIYTDLSLEVLGHRVSVQAREFADLDPDTYGERQRAFEQLVGRLAKLHVRVTAEGSVETPRSDAE